MIQASARKRKYSMIIVAFDELKETIDPVLFAECRVSYKYELLKNKLQQELDLKVSTQTIWRAFKDRKNLKFEIETWKSEKSLKKTQGEIKS